MGLFGADEGDVKKDMKKMLGYLKELRAAVSNRNVVKIKSVTSEMKGQANSLYAHCSEAYKFKF